MRLRRSRRGVGPAAGRNSRCEPRSTPKISAVQRAALLRQIMDQTESAGGTYPFDAQGHLHAPGRQVLEEVADNLQLVLDGLGREEASSGADVVLDLPPEQLRRTFARLRERAIEQREASSEGSAVKSRRLYERALIAIEACDRVLAVVGDDTRAVAE